MRHRFGAAIWTAPELFRGRIGPQITSLQSPDRASAAMLLPCSIAGCTYLCLCTAQVQCNFPVRGSQPTHATCSGIQLSRLFGTCGGLPCKDCHGHGQSLSASVHVLEGQAEVMKAARRDGWGSWSLSRDCIRKRRVAHSLLSMLLNYVGLLEKHKLVAQPEESFLVLLVGLFGQIVRCLLSFPRERCLSSGECGARRRVGCLRQTLCSLVGVQCFAEERPLGASGCVAVPLSHRVRVVSRWVGVCVCCGARPVVYASRVAGLRGLTKKKGTQRDSAPQARLAEHCQLDVWR